MPPHGSSNSAPELSFRAPTRPVPGGWQPTTTVPDSFYLQYHEQRIADVLVHIGSEENPLRCLLLPRAFASPLLRNVVCALSAMHYYRNISGELSAKAAAFGYYDSAVKTLQYFLQDMDHRGWHSRPRPCSTEDLLLAVTWLGVYEVTWSRSTNWRSHLNALRDLIAHFDVGCKVDPEVMRFVVSISEYIQSMALLTARDNGLSTRALTRSSNVCTVTKVDNYLGYTAKIIKVCVRIAGLRADDLSTPAQMHELVNICEHLSRWDLDECDVTSQTLPHGASLQTQARLRTVAKLYYYSAIIYFHSVVDGLVGVHTLENIPPSLCLMSMSKNYALAQLCGVLEENDIGRHCEYSALLFPLFIAACEARQANHQQVIMKALLGLRSAFGLGNVHASIVIIQRVWASQDSYTWKDALDTYGQDLILA